MYSNCCCSCSFEPEIIKIDQLSHKMYSNNIVNFEESPTILNAYTKKVWKLIEGTTYGYMLKQLHRGMKARVIVSDRLPDENPIENTILDTLFCYSDSCMI